MFNVKQKGISPIGVLFVVCTFALLIMVALKLTTHYIDYNSIRSAFKSQAELPETKDASRAKIMSGIDKQLRINSIRDFNLNENAYINNEEGVMTLGVSYEVREHMFANIDVVLSFEYEVEVK